MDQPLQKPVYDDTLKLIAILTMLIDHTGYLLFPDQIAWRLIGRLSFPIFAFLVARGSRLTRSQPRYLLRMLTYGLISQLPYSYFVPHGLNIFFTLAAGIALIFLVSRQNLAIKLLALPILASTWVVDYSYGLYGLLLILAFHFFYDKPALMAVSFTGLSWYYWMTTHVSIQALAMAALPFIYSTPHTGIRLPKHVGYLFYPVHIIILLSIKGLLGPG
ncbi:TraX family protein [Acidaminobacter hydrogenoformans]|uniref:TraX protein n=1 Tax=Acidaminobacter hydrogenoformans DSM 2784 TaxID=1120920 RepID=A0A1G5RZL4_9FIRM|nr:TraX family protein [Acidaminobacter hydrogenoformans]SCZ78901.1 TraX protein [Acidaminobacter hydrogenoformans DSM 2784]